MPRKSFALICDNKLFIKPTVAGRAFIKSPEEAPPYPGAKPSFLIEDKLDDREWLSELVKITVNELPEPKPKKKKKVKNECQNLSQLQLSVFLNRIFHQIFI